MKNVFRIIYLVAFALIITSCSFSFTTANFKNIQVASQVDDDNKPTALKSVFAPTDPMVYVTGSINNAPDGTVIKAEWIYLGTTPQTDIDSVTLDIESATTLFQFSLSKPDAGWPAGKYEVKLSIDDKYTQSAFFEVK